jgi:ketosteroid isomerase-like protein
MSHENVEIVRTLAEGFQHRQHERAFEFYDPGIEWNASALADGYPDIAGIYGGHDGVRQYFGEWLESFEAHEARAARFMEAGDDVIVGIRLKGGGKASGVEVEMTRCNVYRMRDGLAVRVELYETEAEALKAAGL